MKQFYQYIFAAPLYVVFVLFLCFGSCQSSDNAGVGEGAAVASLPLKAQISDASSRVSMSDSYNGTFSCSWNSDQLSIYHPYMLSGAVQAMTTSLPFATTSTSGTSATFSYSGGVGYRYNPGTRLYAFSSGTSGGYTANMGTDGTSTLTANTLASQNGTLTDCAKYDALYGSASVNYSTGLPGSLAMHHLFGMLNLHLTNSGFSTDHPVTVTLNSSALNIIPGNGGNATLNADGSINKLTGSWGNNWYTTITPTTNGVVDVYLMTWPFNTINGTLSISCSDNSPHSYIARGITLSGFSLAAAQVKSQPLAISSAPAITSDIYSKLYTWDATDSKPVTVNTAPTNANTTSVSNADPDFMSRALYACKSCPSLCEISWYLYGNCYWDNGNVPGGNTTSYTCADGTTTKAGIWLCKKSALKDFHPTLFSETKNCESTLLAAIVATGFDLTDYFFLPAVGHTDSNGGFSGAGTSGYYWSSMPDPNTTIAYLLYFDNSGASFIGDDRSSGCCLWTAQ